ncbi:MAG: hypothetical protein ACK4MF_07910, partial [Hyphomicrobiaceae bacterium]
MSLSADDDLQSLRPALEQPAWRLTIVAAASLALAFDAVALDLDGTDGLITETIASRERLKDYDNIKKYGAER